MPGACLGYTLMCDCCFSNSQVSDISKSVVKDKKLTFHNRCYLNIENVVHFFKIAKKAF